MSRIAGLRSGRQRGFSLLELQIAMMLLAFTILALGSGLSTAGRLLGKLEARQLAALEFSEDGRQAVHSSIRPLRGGDTGPLHLAHALGSTVCCVMGPTDPERHGPYGAADRVVVQRLPCSFCHQRLDSVKACLLELSPEEVAERARQVLQAS